MRLEEKALNRLKHEKSPYLKQHAANPVDWFPWGAEAIEKAKKEDKPLLVSIGYSSCHWCHVMERESFEDAETARVMNENYVSVKVDREERPELDSLYMKAVQAMTGQAGWPLTVFTTPEGVPFYGGSYFPPHDGFGLPSFRKVLLAVALAYRKNKERIDSIIADVEGALKRKDVESPVELDASISRNAFEAAEMFFDAVHGGFGTGTKFPHAMFLKFLLLYHRRTGEEGALSMVTRSLVEMAYGGIYDHLGGGFHRYSVDERWEVPHFEKMLYDNALLLELYSLSFEATGMKLFSEVASETAGYMMRDMMEPGGGFYSAEDADSDGQEGAYYLWSSDDVGRALKGKDARQFMRRYSITPEGNCDGLNTLRIDGSLKAPEAAEAAALKEMKKILYMARIERTPPEKDKKIITAWNALAIKALTAAARALKRPELAASAASAASFILRESVDANGDLLRYHLGGRPDVPAALEDYALFGTALVSLFEATGERGWLEKAGAVASGMKRLFFDPEEKLFYDSRKDRTDLFVRERDLYDNDVPSGNSAAAELLFRMWMHTGETSFRDSAEEILRSVEGIRDEPLSCGNALCVLEMLLSGEGADRKIH